nr:energy transducer TonB [Acidobacteriota bacterium]
GGTESAKSGPKKVSVTVTYDESGRVTQASGGDATALRIARQKRFPAGKAGSATITISIN